MAQLPIKRAVERVPGGMMVVPLLLGAIITTFAPDTAKFFGSGKAVPAIVASANSAYAEAAQPATALVAAAVAVTAITVPLATAWWAGRVRAREGGAEFLPDTITKAAAENANRADLARENERFRKGA